MSTSVESVLQTAGSSTPLLYAITHVFLPVELPTNNDYTLENDLSLVRSLCATAHAYSEHIHGSPEEDQWHRITKMLDNLQASIQSGELVDSHVISQSREMCTGDILGFFIRNKNTAVILTKHENSMLCELFEVSPSSTAVEETAGSLICSYPWSAVETPNEAFHDGRFQISFPDAVDSDLPPLPTHPTGILRGVGHNVDVPRIMKRVRDEVNGLKENPWRRSSVWLLIRVTIQMSFNRSPLGRTLYKRFILFFICTLARDANDAHLSNDLLQLIACKILRRLKKLGSSTPDRLSEMALKTCAYLQETLDAGLPRPRPCLFQNPSHDQLARDTRLSLLDSGEYIRTALAGSGHKPVATPFYPSHRRRGTIEDFLSSNGTFFEEAYDVDPEVTLYDVEQSIEQGIDDWFADVTDVDEACTQLGILMEKYMIKAEEAWIWDDQEDNSISFLTVIELFVTLDKLVLKEVPMLADYSPEIPIKSLERLCLGKTTSLHRLSRAYRYLSMRQSSSRPGWSVLSDEFNEDSLPVRYYDQSPDLQQLKVRIERDAMRNISGPDAASQSPFALPLEHAKVVIFELQSPSCFRIWRSVCAQILIHFHPVSWSDHEEKLPEPVSTCVQQLQPDFVEHKVSSKFYLGYDYRRGLSPTLRYAYSGNESSRDYFTGIWQHWQSAWTSPQVVSRRSNDILAAQVECPDDLSLDEFIASRHLRSVGSLQWLNILHGLHSRTLNLRRLEVHDILSKAVFRVGPLDLNTGTWIWHQELQDSSFCNALLDELHSLFVDVGAGSIDTSLMNSISLLLTRLLASSPSEDISERAIVLLRSVRRKTFNWVEELSYNLRMAPINEQRSNVLLQMAVACRSTFDVDIATLRKLCHSAEDVDASLACAFFIHTLRPNYKDTLLQRDRRLSLQLQRILGDTILTDPSDFGVDLAVGKIFAIYQPGTHRWEQLDSTNTRWLVHRREGIEDQLSQTMHLDLLLGELRVDGQPVGGLPHAIRCTEYKEFFRDQGFFVIPSNLPGMDLTTLTGTSQRKVHFSLRDNVVVLQMQYNATGDILELIPKEELVEDLPQVLIYDHVHLLNLSTKILEIRPHAQPWKESSENWKIDCASGEYRAYRGRETLVDVRSPTWEMVFKCLQCLNYIRKESYKFLLISIPSPDSPDSVRVRRLSVALRDSGLAFFVNEMEELESCDFKHMVYDENQCVGALFGLEDMLVLRPKTHIAGQSIPETLIPRRILLRYGGTYHVDTDLGCLMGNINSASTTSLAGLHVETSRHRPDLLTGKTGTQEALFLLQSGECRSIMKFKTTSRNQGTAMIVSKRRPRETRATYNKMQSSWHLLLQWQLGQFISATAMRALQRGAHLLLPWDPIGQVKPLCPTSSIQSPWAITLEQLLFGRPEPELPIRRTLLRDPHTKESNGIPGLHELFSSMLINKSDPPFQHEYNTLLENSMQYALEGFQMTYRLTQKDRMGTLEKYYVECRSNYLDALGTLEKTLGPIDSIERALAEFGQWPPISADCLLRCLASTSPIKVSLGWKKCLTSFALLLLDLQRARRLLRFALDGLEEEFSKELENEGCDGWNPEQYPDWLLIQIQGNFLIRRTQAETAMQMISPQSENNTVMQVNIGEGKSSVIIPIVAAALANSKQLVRVVVPKALMFQMFEILVARLGGLVNRPIYHLPFSRTPKHNDRGKVISLQIDDLQKLMFQCMSGRGILLVQPEHVVSLKLMSIAEQTRKDDLVADSLVQKQKPIYNQIMTAISLTSLSENSFVGSTAYQWLQQLQDKKGVAPSRVDHGFKHISNANSGSEGERDVDDASVSASKWLSLHKWIHSNARDILDECDEILHPRFQLIYTLGLQQHIDGYPDRWTITQQVLRLVKNHIHILSRNHPNCVEYECSIPGSFPHVRIVRASNVGRRLILLIANDIMTGRLPCFKFQHLSPALQDAIRNFISDEDALQVLDTARMVEEYAKGAHQSHLWGGLLLLRGLLACNILLFALSEKRWRVDYGLGLNLESRLPRYTTEFDPFKSTPRMLAVPYRAKDMPALDTRFGHPDIIIILTCLSYYYGGLTEEQLRQSFEILLDEDDPSTGYALWVKDYDGESLPDSLRKFGEINLESSEQWDKVIFPLFSLNQAVIDFYLSRVVFPKKAKEFPLKLSASSWDLAEKREKLVTGFSGTNDTRWLLPMSIAQCDLDHQRGSNARVLAYLLQPENNGYAVTLGGERRSTVEFLRLVAMQEPEIRVLLDVGAQILDLSNLEVAKAWLEITRDVAGAVYFNKNDEMMVLTRSGHIKPVSLSPLSQQLDRCVAYLDHAHTRGTDLKLPIGSRAAVTLGPKLTKDSLVQGCMRMRKLGHGHSVMFFAPLEVDQSIRSVTAKKDPKVQVTTVDILCWAIRETWADIQQRAPYWAQQGMNHKSRYDAWSRFCNGELAPEKLANAWLQPETKSLVDLYAPCETKTAARNLSQLDPGIRRRCKTLGVLSLPSGQMEEEQEREVNREQEREREMELPPQAEPAEHFLHQDVVKFVKTGDIPPLHSGSAFRPIFTTLERTTAATVTSEADVWSPFILATADFCKTIKPESSKGTIDQYLRPVQWILTRSQKDRRGQVLVLLSPFEVNLLMPDIRASTCVHLHLYAPRTSRRMKSSDDLKLYVIPPLPADWTPPWALIDQLNVFAGQLYLRDYDSYLRLCHFLGVPTTESSNDTTFRWNLFNIPGSLNSEEMEIRFSASPLPSVMALLAMRSRGRPFEHTHMGMILQGQRLTEKDFEATGHNPVSGPEDVTSAAENVPSSPLEMVCDAQLEESTGSSVFLSSKRGVETAEIPIADSELPQKRLRVD